MGASGARVSLPATMQALPAPIPAFPQRGKEWNRYFTPTGLPAASVIWPQDLATCAFTAAGMAT